MANDIKSLLDGIIERTDNSYSTSETDTTNLNPSLTFDKGAFREKLSLGVLRDIVSMMMDGHTEDVDGMIDKAILDHIRNDYDGCYDYLCKARDKTSNPSSPMLSDIIQEIDDMTYNAEKKITLTKDDSAINDTIDPLELEKSVDSYAEFREKIRRKVADKIINSVAAEIVGSNDAPTFRDTLDENLEGKAAEPDSATKEPDKEIVPEDDNMIEDNNGEDVKSESVIITAASKIIFESYSRDGSHMETKDAINLAILEYCLTQMDLCFLQHTKENFYSKYIY